MIENRVAIVGAACRLPGANTLDDLWDVVSTGRDVVTEIPDGRWSKAYYFHPSPAERGKSYTWAAGVIDDIDRFDAAFFGISPREAEQIDPQQRLLLELAWQALEDAGIPASRIAGSDGGVYVGASSGDYGDARMGDPAGGDAYFMTGVTASILANRLSYIFDLHGPSFTVDTACSSSLVALEQAYRAIAEGRVPLALVGGISLLLSPFPFIGFCRASMLSPDGRCRAFDARANGYVRAEGGGVVVLKPLGQALADGDRIRAVICGGGVNSDGRTLGLSLPNRAAQTELLHRVYQESGIAPERLSFVEAHGTGTAAGDPIEAAALGEALASRRAAPLRIGSVKTNLGHLEAASGMAGLIKAVLALEHRLMPPSLHFETPNPAIPFATLNIAVADRAIALPADGELLAGVNSFGFGGTNAHIILASAPATAPQRPEPPGTLPPLLLSARSEASLKALAGEWSRRLADLPAEDAAPLLRAAARRRDHHRLRLVAWGDTPFDMAERLDAIAFSGAAPGPGVASQSATSGRLAFVFSGNGVQRPGMARDALCHSPIFRETIEQLDRAMAAELGWSIRDRLSTCADPQILARTDVAQPLLFAIQVATVTALRHSGVAAAGYVGHSVGEIAAGWAAGALSLEDACRIIAMRSIQQQRTAGSGSMAAIGLPESRAEALLAELGGGLEIAAINSAAGVTVAGPVSALARLEAACVAEGVRHSRLDLDYAFHSKALDPIRDDLIDLLGGIRPVDCDSDLISTVEGGPIAGRALDALYWWRNIREPVRFRAAVDHMIAQGYRIFVEIGPNPALLSYIRDGLKSADAQGRVLGSLTHRGGNRDPFPAIAAECHAAGGDISGAGVFDGPQAPDRLPPYPFERSRYWFQPTVEGFFLDSPVYDHPLLGFRSAGQDAIWTNVLSLDLQPWIGDHRVETVPVVPGTAIVEIALAAARHRFPAAASLTVSGVEIPRALTLEPGAARTLRVRETDAGRIEIASRPRLSDDAWAVHAVARIEAGSSHRPETGPFTAPPRSVIAADGLYATADRLGLGYGAGFRVVRQAEIIDDLSARILLDPAVAEAAGDGMIVNPVSFDGALQGLLALLAARLAPQPGETFIPSRFGRVRAFPPFGRGAVQADIAIDRIGTRSVSARIRLFDDAGRTIAEAEDCWFQRVRLSRHDSAGARIFRFDRIAAPLADSLPQMDLRPEVGPQPGHGRYDEIALLFDGFVAASALAAILDVTGGVECFTPDDLQASGTICVESAGLLDLLLAGLERHGLATSDGDGWRLSAGETLPEPSVIWRTILADAPELAAELALAGAADLPRLLREGFDSAPLPPALVDQMLYASPSGRAALDGMADAVGRLVAAWPRNRPLRILEAGAGSGPLTRRVLARLDGWDGTLRYVVSDPDGQRVQLLAAAHAAIAGVTARQWDPTDAAKPSFPEESGFDLVLSLYGAARRHYGRDVVSRMHAALAPGGMLLAAEPEASDIWAAVFSQRADYWRAYSSHESGAADPVARLAGALRDAGFEGPRLSSLSGGVWPVSILAARKRPYHVVSPLVRTEAAIILIAPASDALARALTRRLAEDGIAATTIDPPEVADGAALCALLAEAGAAPPQIVVLPLGPGLRAGEGAAAAAERMVAMLTVARLTADIRESARMWIVTRDAQAADRPSPAEAALWGLGRTLMNEMAQLDCRLLDLPAAWPAEDCAKRLAEALTLPDDEREIVWTDTGREALRLRQGPPDRPRRTDDAVLAIGQPGLLDTLAWRETRTADPGPGEIAIAVEASGLNFRDVMWAMGLLPEEALLDGFSGPTLGLECAGTVTATGPGVEAFAVGDRVLALAPAALRTRVVTKAHAAARIPDGTSFVEAATLPVACLTVLYALETLARLEPGETVLIHGGAGGVGLAAIQYARHRGARIIATAGSTVKRAFLARLGVDHVLDSRSLAFADQIRALTGGKGVDVVVNSLSGEAMERSLGLLQPFGRFIELGKRDFALDTRVGLRALRQNIAYYAVDVDRLPVERPELAARLLAQVTALVGAGVFQPLPYRVFSFAEAPEAFRLMQASGHIGKIVLIPDGLSVPAAAGVAPTMVGPDRTYLVVGGLSGFGLATARWLASQGARHLALASRRGADSPGAATVLAGFAGDGVTARAFACDAAEDCQVAAMLARIRGMMPPLGGVVHAAMVVDDGLAGSLTAERIARVLAPKLDGAQNLDRLTRTDPLDFFLLYSSATTLLGAPGQGSYVAANMALEALARRRRAEGLPALAVAWGPIGDAGYLAESEKAQDALLRRLSTAPIQASEALDALPGMLASAAAVLGFAPVRWDKANPYLPILASLVYADVATTSGEADATGLKERLDLLPPAEAKALIVTLLTEEAARILSFAPDRIDPARPLSEFGMDSLMAVELRLALQTRLGMDVPLVSLSDNTTLSAIAQRLVANLARPAVTGGLDEMLARHETAHIVPGPSPGPAAATAGTGAFEPASAA